MRAIGLMSGTSLDGVDAALVEVVPAGDGYAVDVVRFRCDPFEEKLQRRLRTALPPHVATPSQIAALDAELGEVFARTCLELTGGEPIDFVASHGLTLFHHPTATQTMQIGDPYRVRDAVDASVVFDFRRADCARGGSGAPLVPYVDALLFASSECDVVALNIGGIANVTVLERGARTADARAWDTGPGNMVLDAFVASRTGGAQAFDRAGELAERGMVDARVLAELIAREAFFLALPPPKSTGRERFGAHFLEDHRDLFARLSLEDGCATLAAFTAATISESLASYGPAGARVIASGGGTHNRAVMKALAERLGRTGGTLETSDTAGVDPDAKEAVAFAILGYETLRERPASLPGATGARQAALLGAIAPCGLEALFAKMRAEVAAKHAR